MNENSLIAYHEQRSGNSGRVEKALFRVGAIGKANRCSADDIMGRIGIGSKRDLCTVVQKERSEGALICSTKCCGGGYYLAESAAEVEAFVQTFSNEARALFWMQKHFRQFLKEHDEQA